MKTLDEIAIQTTTDKSSLFHQYCDTYAELFAPLRDKPVTILEQGVLAGDSLLLWDGYFTHPETRIYGIDIEDHHQKPLPPRVTFMMGSQADTEFLTSVIARSGPCNIIIDDAGHFSSQQIPAFAFLWPYVEPGGYYIVEDTHTSWSYQHSHEGGRILDYFHTIADELNDHGADAHGKPLTKDKWYSIEWIMFRKGLVILKKRASRA